MELKDFEYNFIDKLYDYDGLWGRKATCGVKVLADRSTPLVIATDIYKGNPGGSITEFCAELATILANEHALDKENMIFIHHTPEVGSSAEYYGETFYKVKFDINNNAYINPDWEPIERDEVVELVNG